MWRGDDITLLSQLRPEKERVVQRPGGRDLPGRESRKCKGPGVGVSLTVWSSQNVIVA